MTMSSRDPGQTDLGEDEFTELVDADFGRIDLVGKGANSMPFLIAKAAEGGVFDPDTVRSLIGKAEPTSKEHTVTLTASPAAMAALIHGAPVRKADVPEPDEQLPEPGEVKPDLKLDGDPTDPDSPAWEAVDAAVAGQALDLVLALRRLLEQSLAREDIEATAGTGGEINEVLGLQDALCAVDCIIGVLAPFQVNEAAEAQERQADREALMKGQVRKAGRVLSTANEASIRSASDLLQKVLASLPAPTEPDAGAPVTKKEYAMTEAAPAATVVEDVPVEKAKGDPMTPVYDDAGKLVGMVDSADLIPIAPAAPATAADDAPADAAPAPATEADLTPAPADAAGVPADAAAVPAPVNPDDVTKALPADVLKGLMADVVKEALEDAEAKNAEVVKALQDQIDFLKAPAPLGVLTNGALPPAHQERHGQGSVPVDVAKATELRAALQASDDPAERESIAKQMQEGAISALQALRASGRAVQL